MFKNLRITPHSKLEELHQVWNEEENKYENDQVNKMCIEFSGRYDRNELWGFPQSLTKTNDESVEDWKVRVEKRQEEIKAEWKKDYEEGDRRENFGGIPNRRNCVVAGNSMKNELYRKLQNQIAEQDSNEDKED